MLLKSVGQITFNGQLQLENRQWQGEVCTYQWLPKVCNSVSHNVDSRYVRQFKSESLQGSVKKKKDTVECL